MLKSWLEQDGLALRSGSDEKLDVLEIGCLSPTNAIAGCRNVKIERIDLHSSHPSILEQDFMMRPLPNSDEERFDIVSLSLVLNYVATPGERGEMLKRTTAFLRTGERSQRGEEEELGKGERLPLLFFVLPLPCVRNSRYLTEEHLRGIIQSLGYGLRHSKRTSKLFYSLWHFDPARVALREFKKTELSPGHAKNNFCITFKE